MDPQSTQACKALRLDLIGFADWFLWVAFILLLLWAAAELLVKVAPIFKTSYPPTSRSLAPADAAKLLDAFKGLITAITTAPAWIGAFAASVALIWAAFNLIPACT